MNAEELYKLDPGSAEARAEGCICDSQEPRIVGHFCSTCQAERTPNGPCPKCGASALRSRPRRAFNVEQHCPVHGLAVAKALLDG